MSGSTTLLLYSSRRIGCRKSFQTNSGRIKHEKKCSYVASSKSKGYTKFVNGKIQCSTCDKTISYLSHFYRHFKEVHKKKQPRELPKKCFSCTVCSKTFTKKSKHNRHKLSHNKPSYSCEICSHTYQRYDKFKDHEAKCILNLEFPEELTDDVRGTGNY